MLNARGAGRTDAGRVRDRNEDCFVADDTLGFYAVSDGMGGHAAGEVASRTAIDVAHEVVRGHRETLARIADGAEGRATLTRIAEEAVSAAARRVHEVASSPGGQSGMGCTLTVLLLVDLFGAMAHVGDSRLYQLRKDRVTQLSQDHTMVAEMVRQGMGNEERLKNSPFAHVLNRAVGPQADVLVDTLAFSAVSGDRYVLCSDGLSNYLDGPDVLARFVGPEVDETGLAASADELVQLANERGGEDNITALVVSVGGDAAEPGQAEAVESRYEALNSMFMFASLDRAMVARVLEVCTVDRHDADEVVVELGEESSELMIVVGGRYQLSDASGPLGDLSPGDYAGATTLIRARPARARLRALQPSKLLRLSADAFSGLIRRRPWLGIFLLERLGNKISGDLDRSYQQREGSADSVRVRERF